MIDEVKSPDNIEDQSLLNNEPGTPEVDAAPENEVAENVVDDTAENSVEEVASETPEVENAQPAASEGAKARSGKGVIIKVASVIVPVVQALIITFLLCGAVSFYYSDVTLIQAVNLIIKLFYINNATIYRTLFGVAVAVMYFAVLVFLIKWLVSGIRKCIAVMKNQSNDVKEIMPMVKYSFDRCVLSFGIVMGFAVICGLIATADITGLEIALMVIIGVVLVGRNVLNYIVTSPREELLSFILNAVKNVLVFLGVCVMIVFLNNHAGRTLLYGLQAMFNGNVLSSKAGLASSFYALYACIVEPAILVSIAVIFLVFFIKLLRGIYTEPLKMRKKFIAMIVLTGVTIILHLVFKVFVASGSIAFRAYMIGTWLKAISKTYIPLLFAEVSLFILFLLNTKPAEKAEG